MLGLLVGPNVFLLIGGMWVGLGFGFRTSCRDSSLVSSRLGVVLTVMDLCGCYSWFWVSFSDSSSFPVLTSRYHPIGACTFLPSHFRIWNPILIGSYTLPPDLS